MKTEVDANVQFKIMTALSEEEARALHAIQQYGIKSFLEVFYKSLGKDCLQPHESGLVSLFEHVRTNLGEQLKNIDTAKSAINNLNIITPIH